MSYAKVLKKAGRLEDVIGVLNKITAFEDDTDMSYPIHPVKSRVTGEWIERVPGAVLKKQATQIKKIILSGYVLVYPDKDFQELLSWLDARREQLVNNYSNYLSHGVFPYKNAVLPGKSPLEEIRILSIVILMIHHIILSEKPCLPEIPDGWKKQGIKQKVKQVALFVRASFIN